MGKIKSIVAREILDSRGNPTVGVNITLDNNISCLLYTSDAADE